MCTWTDKICCVVVGINIYSFPTEGILRVRNYKSLESVDFEVICPQNGTAVLKGLKRNSIPVHTCIILANGLSYNLKKSVENGVS